MDDTKRTAADDDDADDDDDDEEDVQTTSAVHHAFVSNDTITANDDVGLVEHSDKNAAEDIFKEAAEPRHRSVLGGDSSSSVSVSLRRCSLRDCCDHRVHCPFCDVRQYKPTQHARVRDHLHLTHFQHAVYYDGMMVVKCFHTCRSSSAKGGHYHCPVCCTTLLKRNAFTSHLLSHASKQGLDSSAVQAPDAKKPSVVYYDDHKIQLCHLGSCSGASRNSQGQQPHFHCPLCWEVCTQLSALTAHLWRCEKRASSMASRVDMTGYSLNVPKLFSPDMVQGMPCLKELTHYQWHLSVVRNLSDLPLARCELPDCCKGRYHCPLCTTAKLKPNHLSHMKQHFVSHWRSGVPFKSYTVLVCYLPCEVARGGRGDRVRFHYHCPLCGATRRRRQGFAKHLQICDPSKPTATTVTAEEEEMEQEEEEEEGVGEEGEGGDAVLEKFPLDGDTFVPLSETDAWPSQTPTMHLASLTLPLPLRPSRRASADQAELQAAESLVHMDLRIQMESLSKSSCRSSLKKESRDAAFSSSHTTSTLEPRDKSAAAASSGRTGVWCQDCTCLDNGETVELVDRTTENSWTGEFLDRLTDCPHHAMLESVQKSSGSMVYDVGPRESLNSSQMEVVESSGTVGLTVPTDPSEVVKNSGTLGLTVLTDPSEVVKNSGTLGLTVPTDPSTKVVQNSGTLGLTVPTDPSEVVESSGTPGLTVPTDPSRGSSPGTGGLTFQPGSEGQLCQASSEHQGTLPDFRDRTHLPDQQDSTHCEPSQATSQSDDRPAAVDVTAGCQGVKISAALQESEETDSVSQSSHGSDQHTAAIDERRNTASGAMTDNVQIFQQVSTQVSDSIIQDLQKRGILEETLWLIGQLCKVTWQQSGDSVTMTCDLEMLCPAQSCFKQILKDGLQKFKNSPSVPVTSPSDDSTAPHTACKPARKRGRPRGSKNKATLLKEQEDASDPASKRLKRNEDVENSSAAGLAVEPSLPPQQQGPLLHGASKPSDSENGRNTDASQTKDFGNELPAGGCSRRTRGKRINFAQLNAGNLSPVQDKGAEGTKTAPEAPPTTGKRSRGRPRKVPPGGAASAEVGGRGGQLSNAAALDLPSQCFEESRASSAHTLDRSSRLHYGRVLSSEKNGGKAHDPCTRPLNEKTPESSVRSGAEDKAAGETSFKKSCEATVTVLGNSIRDVSGAEPHPGEEQPTETTSTRGQIVWVPYTSPVRRRHSQRGVNSPSMPVMITTPETPPEPAPMRPDVKQSLNATTRPSSSTPAEGKGTDREAEETVRSPAITRRLPGQHQRGQSTTSFAIIPSVVFDFLGDAEGEDENPQPSVHNNDNNDGRESSADVGDGDTAPSPGERRRRDTSQTSGEAEPSAAKHTQTETLFRCPECSLTLATYALLTEHLSARHGKQTGSVSCDLCQVVLPTPGALTLHLERGHGPQPQGRGAGPFRCESCGKECLSPAALRWHRTLLHKDKEESGASQGRLRCSLCHYVAMDRWDMKHHRERHRDQPTACFICAKKFGAEASLKIHMAAKHSGHSYSCHLCHKTFAHVRYLRSHLQRHGGEKRHVCPVCGWRFFQTNTLRAHMDTHKPKGQRRYAFRCPHCPAAYNSQANYRDHLNKHTGERPHTCGQCGRGFAFRSMLTTHMAFVHSSSRPHACGECDKKYKTKTQLRQHQMTHTLSKTGTSPFMCATCGRAMASKSRLRAHALRCKGSSFVWHQRVAPPGGHQTKVKAVDLLSGQTVNIVDLLPGQHINVQHCFGKDTTITLIPVPRDAARQPPALTGPAHHKSLFAAQQDPNPALSELNTDVCSETPTTRPQTVQRGDGSQQVVLVSSSAISGAVSNSESSPGESTDRVLTGVGMMTDNSGTSIASDSSGGSQVLVMDNGQTFSLLSNLSLPQLTDSLSDNNSSNRQTGEPSTSQTGITVDAIPGFTQEILQTEAFQSERAFQTASSASHRLVVRDGLGQTQTLLLPPEMVKQEVVVIQTDEGGHHNILNLANVQFVQEDSLLQQPGREWQDRAGEDDNNLPAQILPGGGGGGDGGGGGEQTLVLQTEPLQVDANSFPLQSTAEEVVRGAADGQSEEGVVGGGAAEEVSVYICSVCDQQFSCMELAQQHVLLTHSVDPPPLHPPFGTHGDTEGSGSDQFA